jgi:hypothetical protein
MDGSRIARAAFGEISIFNPSLPRTKARSVRGGGGELWRMERSPHILKHRGFPCVCLLMKGFRPFFDSSSLFAALLSISLPLILFQVDNLIFSSIARFLSRPFVAFLFLDRLEVEAI